MIAWLTPCLEGQLAYWQPLVQHDAGQPDALPATRLMEPGTAERLVAQFSARYAGADQRAAVSLWSQWYFGTLVVPSAAALVVLGRSLPVALDDVRLLFDGEGKLQAVLLKGGQEAEGGGAGSKAPSLREGLAPLIEGHLTPVIGRLAQAFAVSPRVLWTNVAAALDWALAQVQPAPPPGQRPACDLRNQLTGTGPLPERRHPLLGTLREVADGEGILHQRRTCCLRYLLPGVACCGGICPLPEARRTLAPVPESVSSAA